MANYLVLAKYRKTGKRLWWCTSCPELYKKGRCQLLSGTTTETEVEIIDLLEISQEQTNAYE